MPRRSRMVHSIGGVAAALVIAGLACRGHAQTDPARVQVREGYAISVAVDELPGARFLALDPDGTLYVSRPGPGDIVALRDADGDGVYEQRTAFVEGHRTVHAMQWVEGWLWFTQTGAVLRARDTDGDGAADETVQVLGDEVLPADGSGHWWRSLLVHDGRIYTSIGDAGNIEDPGDSKRQKIWSYALDGSDERLFASGLRNTEKLVVRPGTDEIWGMDHGSDWFGGVLEREADQGQPITDFNPPEEMNHYVQGGFYGHPFVVESRIVRYEFMNKPGIVELAAKTTPPAWEGGAHWAANSMTFYAGDQFPGARGDAFVAYHGSWNRSEPAGYCVARVLFDSGRPYGELVYAGFLTAEGEILGRPVDTAVAPDGSLLISDDHGGRVYRMSYTGQ